jgi:MOSC domain-containing protein
MTEPGTEPAELRETVIPVGVLASLSRYPVKSMRGETLAEAEVRFQGIRGDRRFAFIQGHDRSRFPWLTAREVPRMLLYQAALVDPADPDNSPAVVTTPEGRQLDVFSDALVDELRSQGRAPARNQPIYAVHLKSAHDAEPVSLVTTHALRRLGERLGETVDARRFRQNLVIDTDGVAYPDEQTWISGRLVIGSGPGAVTLAVTRGDERCMMPNLHPDTAVQDGRILRTITQQQNSIMGVYASVARQGTIHAGDPVYLILAAH